MFILSSSVNVFSQVDVPVQQSYLWYGSSGGDTASDQVYCSEQYGTHMRSHP